jgi:hypothetical protein
MREIPSLLDIQVLITKCLPNPLLHRELRNTVFFTPCAISGLQNSKRAKDNILQDDEFFMSKSSSS